MRLTLAGASGFVGKHVAKKLKNYYQINALSRRSKKQDDGLNWIETDLFSFKSTSNALSGSKVAIYLVHSMLPSSKLFQGNFQDTDLLLADNFAKACVENGIEQIIYLGGLVPTSGTSKHLESRKEVEDVLKGTGIPVTILRAGMIVGDGGSSFEILKNLVFNLPGMLLPKWTNSNTQTVYIDDLVSVIFDAIKNEKYFNKTINVVNGEKITYGELIKLTAENFGLKKVFFSVPINYTSFSKLWVKIFGEADYELVSPLIDSLLCDLPHPDIPEEVQGCIKYKSYKNMLHNISPRKTKKAKRRAIKEVNNVRSIQRLPNILNLNQEQVSNEYIYWLPKYLGPIIKAKRNGEILSIYFWGISLPLLILKKIEDKNSLDRVKFHIVGGLLSKSKNTGWLEFRLVNNGSYTLASINEYIPSLPWYLYKISQAPIHAAVMRAFGRHLINISLRETSKV